MGFKASIADAALFIRHREDGMVYCLVHVDDCLIGGKAEGVNEVKKVLGTVFKIQDMGNASFFLNMEITRDRAAKTIKLSQMRYAADTVAKFGMSDAKPKQVPLTPGTKLLPDEGEPLSPEDRQLYMEMVGSILYLSVNTRPDIAQAVGVLSRFMSAPTDQHLAATRGLLKYIATTPKLGIMYGGGTQDDLIGYCDSDYGGDLISRRSTTGSVFILNGGIISWSSRLQPTVAASTTEAEYMAAAAATKEALWLRKLLCDFGINKFQRQPVEMYGDNQAAIKLIKNNINSQRSKHIDTMHHVVRDRYERGEITFTYIPTDRMIADAMTKPLPTEKFQSFRLMMGIK
jgi:hypothetical protein